MALTPLKIAALQQNQPITDATGNPAPWFMRSLNNLFKQIVDAVNAVIAAQNAADAAQAAANTAQGTADGAQTSADTAQSTANGAVSDAAMAQAAADAAQATADTKVTKNTTAHPVYSAYPGQTVSNPPTQAEMQALDNAVKALSAAVVSINSKLQTAEVFS